MLSANDTLIFDVFDYDYHGGYFGAYSQNGEMHLADVNVHYNVANANVNDISVSNTNLIYLPNFFFY